MSLNNKTEYFARQFEPRRDFQQCCILNSVDSDESVQPPFYLSLETPKDVRSVA